MQIEPALKERVGGDYSVTEADSCLPRSGEGGRSAMAEVPDAGERHGDAAAVGGFDDLWVADGAAGLNDGGGPGVGDDLETVGKGEEGVGGGDGAGEREDSLGMAPKRAASTRDICPAPMPTVWGKPASVRA